MSVTTAFIWGIFLFVINAINPETTNWVGFALFYATLFLALSGTAAIVGFFFRFKVLKKEMVYNSVKTAFRQSFIFSLMITMILYLLSENLFSWFNLILLIIILTLIEFLTMNYNPKK
jgi:hypothetical protein